MQKYLNYINIFLVVIMLMMTFLLGLAGHVGIGNIIVRMLIYSILLVILLAIINILLKIWVGFSITLEDNQYDLDDESTQKEHKKKNRQQNNQASELGNSLDIRDEDTDFSSIPPNNIKDIEPQKAAKAIQEMLARDNEVRN